MTLHPHFTNEELTAYLDGVAGPELARAIETAKAASPEVRGRLASLQIDPLKIKVAFDALLPTAPVLPVTLTQARPGQLRAVLPWRMLAATALVSLALGWATSSLVTHWANRQTTTWQHYAATYHAMYRHETLAHVRPSPSVTADDLSRISQALGLTVSQDLVTRSDALEFKRAQVLGFEGQPVAQLAFTTKAGVPVALCIARVDVEGSVPVRTATVLGMSSATWSKGRYQYLLIGGTELSTIAVSANAFAKAL
jgi:anti-sigma factor RsiW